VKRDRPKKYIKVAWATLWTNFCKPDFICCLISINKDWLTDWCLMPTLAVFSINKEFSIND
jgi:hypothetical protein